jgi:hypothetical protein
MRPRKGRTHNRIARAASLGGGFNDLNKGSRCKPELPVGHHLLSGTDATSNHGLVCTRPLNLNDPVFHRQVGLHDKDILSLLTGLDRLRRNDSGAAITSEGQEHVYELAGP